jgi:hypothetical protein
MLKHAFLLLALCGASLHAGDLPDQYAAQGQLILGPFQTAPFPHPLRNEGHYHGTNFFSAAEHYQDSQVAIFVPKDFRAGSKTDFLVHFHGWNNTATNALRKYALIDQFAASKCNAILIVPQGPYDAPDCFGGKLEDVGGFERFMTEAVKTLKDHGVIKSDKIGRIILSGHSGGYEVISSIVAWGGLNDHIREVWLFDALYANTERFAVWFDHHQGRLIDIYTDHGGTMNETLNLMAALKGNGIPFYQGTETGASAKDLKNHLVFLHSELPHDEVVQKNEAFRRFLETSVLAPARH